MEKKNNNFELKLYELMGIKGFKKAAFNFRKIIVYPFTIKMSKEERKEFLAMPDNYNMKKGNGLDDLRDFKSKISKNTLVHTIGLGGGVIYFASSFLPFISHHIVPIVSVGLFTFLNLYCVLLQRYNYLRINKVIKKYEPTELVKKAELKHDLTESKNLIKNLDCFIINQKGEEKEITFEESIKNASLTELKEYQKYLKEFIDIEKNMKNGNYKFDDDDEFCYGMHLKDKTYLSLRYQPKK